MTIQEAKLSVAQNDLNVAQAQLDAKQAELDEVQALYDKAVQEKQVNLAKVRRCFEHSKSHHCGKVDGFRQCNSVIRTQGFWSQKHINWTISLKQRTLICYEFTVMTPGYLEFDNPGYKELEMHSKSVVSCILTSLTITLTLLDNTLF